MTQLSTLIESEIADFFAGFGGPGEPDIQSGEAQRLLTDRINGLLAAELQERPRADAPELKLAHLINKFYERYPLDTFKNDGERSAALGYFMAGAELQCFGEFVKYEELYGDE